MNNTPHTIFLDLDGPLLDGKDRHYFCYQKIVRSFGLEPIGKEAYWEDKRNLGNRRDLLKRSGAESQYDAFLAAWLALIETPEILAFDQVQPGAMDCLRAWRIQGIRLVLVTLRADAKALEAQLERLGLRALLDVVLVCDHASGGAGKARRVYEAFPGESFREKALWIGDTEADWEAAKALGCPVILVTNGLRTATYLESLGGAQVVSSIVEVNGATGI